MTALALRSPIRPRARRAVVTAAVATAALVGGLLVGQAPGASPAHAASGCGTTLTVFVWDGSSNDTPGQVGDGMDWNDPFNWNVDCVPGLRFEPHDDDVTIPAGAKVSLGTDESAQVAALHNRGALTITPTASLEVFGASQSKTTTLQGTLAGPGTFTVTSALRWVATAQGSSTMETRWCFKDDDCTTGPAPSSGVTVINVGATLTVSGRGVNLEDQRIIENHGKTTLSGNGYIAADYGTEFRNLRLAGDPVPQFVFANNLGYYQGFATAGFSLSTFANTGKVTKTGGTGTSIIDANYLTSDTGTTATGTVEVHTGTLSLFTPSGASTVTAKVQQGAELGNGAPEGCDPLVNQANCQVVQPTSSDPLVATVELTKPGSTSSNVTIAEVPTAAVPGERGVPVQIDAPTALADTAHPLLFRFLLDSTLRHAGESAQTAAATATVSRQATTSDPYVLLPNCVTGQPSTTVPVCVDRATSASETMARGNVDVVIVVASLANSRYRIG